jgi:hypothetical protein
MVALLLLACMMGAVSSVQALNQREGQTQQTTGAAQASEHVPCLTAI